MQVRLGQTSSGAGQAPISSCQQAAWSGLGANAEFNRLYELSNGNAGASIGSFASHDAAVRAASTMAARFDCSNIGSNVNIAADSVKTRTTTRTLATGSTAHLLYATWTEKYAADAAAPVLQLGVTAVGTHVELIELDYHSQEANDQPIIDTLNAAMPRLAR